MARSGGRGCWAPAIVGNPRPGRRARAASGPRGAPHLRILHGAVIHLPVLLHGLNVRILLHGRVGLVHNLRHGEGLREGNAGAIRRRKGTGWDLGHFRRGGGCPLLGGALQAACKPPRYAAAGNCADCAPAPVSRGWAGNVSPPGSPPINAPRSAAATQMLSEDRKNEQAGGSGGLGASRPAL